MSEEPSPLPSDMPTSNPTHIHRPVPRRYFEMSTPASEVSHSSSPTRTASSDFAAQLDAKLRRSRTGSGNGGDLDATSRTKSFLNMTSSTLFGIYSDAGTADRTEPSTPWGTGAETPARHGSEAAWDNNPLDQAALNKKGGELWERPRQKQKQGVWGYLLLISRILALFAFGVAYGVIVSHLHDTRNFAPVRMQGVDRTQWQYYTVWGLAGVILGSLLPYVDLLWDRRWVPEQVRQKRSPSRTPLSEQWNPVVRSIGAFVGIAFAIRKLPWQSTLQVSVTLALVNPALWYILDRSKPGLTLSTIVSVILTSVLLLAKPDVVPSPAVLASNGTRLPSASTVFTGNANTEVPPVALFAGLVSYERLGVATWIASVVFCSCICFGNIGRRLAVLDSTRWSQ